MVLWHPERTSSGQGKWVVWWHPERTTNREGQRAPRRTSNGQGKRVGVVVSGEDKQRAGQAGPKEDKQLAGHVGGQAATKQDAQRATQAGAVRRALNDARETLASRRNSFTKCGREPMRYDHPVPSWMMKGTPCCNRLQAHHPMSLRDQTLAHPLLRL